MYIVICGLLAFLWIISLCTALPLSTTVTFNSSLAIIEDELNATESNQDKHFFNSNNCTTSHTPTHCGPPDRQRRYIPFARPTLKSGNESEDCSSSSSSSSDDFPQFFTHEQRKNGGIILCLLVGLYGFTLLAIVCDNYFLPCVERICETLDLSQDVAAATFMSIATSCPELFTNIIGTFITESDIGIGTIVGSSLFNALGVASIGGLAAVKPIQLDWWPVTRDVIIYIIAVSILVVITWDNKIFWYEGLTLFIVAFVYFIVMFQNERISKFVKRMIKKYKVEDINSSKKPQPNNLNNTKSKQLEVPVKDEHKHSVQSAYGSYMEETQRNSYNSCNKSKDEKDTDSLQSIFVIPKGKIWSQAFFYYTWPIKFVLFCTIPDSKKHPKLFPITFIMCILWIGSNSYLISWMISIIGSVFRIPDAVLGLTFLAAGGCLPESISITIMSRRGEGSMGVSNSLGANTMNILLSLGMPWFLKTIMEGTTNSAYIKLQSGSIEYTILALVVVALTLYLTLYLAKFRLSKTVGVILVCVYLVCVVLAILSEMLFFNTKSKPICM